MLNGFKFLHAYAVNGIIFYTLLKQQNREVVKLQQCSLAALKKSIKIECSATRLSGCPIADEKAKYSSPEVQMLSLHTRMFVAL
jgi:hypothetical protein